MTLSSPTARKLHDVITGMCANPGRSFRKQEHAACLYALLPSSHIPREVAALFVEATTFTAAFTEIRTTESLEALKKLCQIRTPVVDNLLHCIAQMSDAEQTRAVLDATGPRVHGVKSTVPVSFEAQRVIARQELTRRSSPLYEIKHYYDVPESIIAIEVLGESRAPHAAARLLELFHAGDDKEKRAVIQALTKIGGPAAVGCLHEIFVAEKDVKTRRAALRALAGCKTDDSQVPSLASAMHACLIDRDASVREAALQWLRDRSDAWRRAAQVTQVAETRERLLTTLQETDPNVLYHAVDSLGEIGLAEDVGPLEECARRIKPAAVPRVKDAIKKVKHRAKAV
jgi:HEAT repeat protein